jgi:myo-inositol-1(or 4)-monophosphatase
MRASEAFPNSSDDLRFTIDFVEDAGAYMVSAREAALVSRKLDKTAVTDVDEEINRRYIAAVEARSGGKDSVLGEEKSARVAGSEKIWIVDPVDGTGEYIKPNLTNSERTSCVGAAMLRAGELQLAVVHNPFRREMFVADRDLGGTFLNGHRLDVTRTAVGRLAFGKDIPYDFCQWDGGATDARFFEQLIGAPPLGSYSAINQACDVARGRSAFDVFPGDTIHDIAPSALVVELAGGIVSGIDGEPLDWQNLNGAVYAANARIHDRVIQELSKRM